MEIDVKVKNKDGSTEKYKYGPQEKYDKNNTVRTNVKFNKNTDADILEFLEKSGNKQGTIKAALREMMKREKNE